MTVSDASHNEQADLEVDLTGADPDAGEPLTPAQRIRLDAKEAARRALLEAGLVATVAEGGAIPSIEAICKRAGYTRGAFYVYFDDRDQFVEEMLGWVLSDIVIALFESPTEGAADLHEVVLRFDDHLGSGGLPEVEGNIRAAYLAVLRELRPGTSVRQRHAELMLDLHRRLSDRLSDGQVAGSFRTDVDAQHAAMIMLLAAIGAIVWNDVGILKGRGTLGASLLKLFESPTEVGVTRRRSL